MDSAVGIVCLRHVPRGTMGFGLLALLALPPVAVWLEATLSRHLLVQIPLLAVSGYLLGPVIGRLRPRRLGGYNTGGVPGVLLAMFAASFWMLPRSLDAVLADSFMEIAKFVSVPVFIGIPLALSWHKLHAIAKGFIWANLISMLAVLGWLYLASPVRLCNSYLLDQQHVLGWAMLALAAGVAVCQAGGAFVGHLDGSGSMVRLGCAPERADEPETPATAGRGAAAV